MERQRRSFNAQDSSGPAQAARPWGQQAHGATMAAPKVSADAITYLKQVYAILSASLLLAVVAGYVGMGIPALAMAGIGGMLLRFAIMMGTAFLAFRKPGAPTLFLMTGTWGLLAGPIIAYYAGNGMSGIVGQALFLTAVITAGMSLYALTTKRDLSVFGGILFAGVIVILVGAVANIFFQSPALQFAIAGVGAVIFSGFIAYDTQQLKDNAWALPPAAGAVMLFMSIYNLFMMLLQLLGIFGGDD